jgi:adenylate kinase
LVSRVPGYRHVIVGELVREKGLHAGAGAHGALQIDEASEDRIVDELEGVLAEGCTLLEHHSVDFFPERWFDLVLVLRTDNTVLFDRLTKRCVWLWGGAAASPLPPFLHASTCHPPPLSPPSIHSAIAPMFGCWGRGYTPAKVSENVQCEIMEVVAEEVRDSYREEITHFMTSNTLEDLEANVQRVRSWLEENKGDLSEGGAAGGAAGRK